MFSKIYHYVYDFPSFAHFYHFSFIQRHPLSLILIVLLVWPDLLPNRSIAPSVSYPLDTFPKTTCLPSRCGNLSKHMKNCDPLVPGPEFAIESTPGPTCLCLKFSSANFSPSH